MKKILHICQAPIGGTVEYLRLFLENIDKSKYENILICPSSGNMKKILENKLNKIYLVEMEREISLKKDLKDIFEIRRILKEEKADIVYLHSSKAGALGRLASLGLKTKILYNPHGWAFTINCSHNKKKIYAYIEKLLYSLTDIIINISEDEYSKALEYKIPAKKMITIENGIDIKKFSNNSKEKFLDRYVLGFVGRLSEQKNPLYLIEIAKKIKKDIPNCLFYVVGNGELKEELKKKIKENKLDEYFYLKGWSEKVEEDIRNFDLALMISNWEGFGLVVCEYMAAKKPVIAFPVGGVKNIITNEINGILTNKNLIIENILKLKNDEVFRKKIIENADKIVKEKFSIGNVIEKHEMLLENKL